MKHVMYGDKSLLMDDDSADALIEYAGAIARAKGGDTIELKAVGDDGNDVTVTFLLNSATVLIVESATGNMQPPVNADAVAEIRQKMHLLRHPPASTARELDEPPSMVDFDEMR